VRTRYKVSFTNVNGCAVGATAIEFDLDVEAESEAEALELALRQARIINVQTGLPPHGIRVSEDYLRTLAVIIPAEQA
jgi:hypothetical protein